MMDKPLLTIIYTFFCLNSTLSITSCNNNASSNAEKLHADSIMIDSLNRIKQNNKIEAVAKNLNTIRFSDIKNVEYSIDFDTLLGKPVLLEEFTILDIEDINNNYYLTISIDSPDDLYYKTCVLKIDKEYINYFKNSTDDKNLLLVELNKVKKVDASFNLNTDREEGEAPQSELLVELPPTKSVFRLNGNLIKVIKNN